MHIEITPENLLIQLGYPTSDPLLMQAEKVMNSTKNFSSFSKHLPALIDELSHYDGYLALSNSRDALKIKCDSKNSNTLEAYNDLLYHWSDKYKIDLKKVSDTNTYYILGQTS